MRASFDGWMCAAACAAAAWTGASCAAERRVAEPPMGPTASLIQQRAFVSHAVGSAMSVIDLRGDHAVRAISLAVSKVSAEQRDARLRAGGQGYALARAVVAGKAARSSEERKAIDGSVPAPPPPKEVILAPMVTVDHGEVQVPSVAYYGPPIETVPRAAPMVGVVDVSSERPRSRVKLAAARVRRR